MARCIVSTYRYSGAVRIRVTYLPPNPAEAFADGTPRHPNGSYRCALACFTPAGQWNETVYHRARVRVGAPACLSHAVDSPEAYDDAASAALSFASYDDSEWGDKATHNRELSAWHVGRAPSTRWPSNPSLPTADLEVKS